MRNALTPRRDQAQYYAAQQQAYAGARPQMQPFVAQPSVAQPLALPEQTTATMQTDALSPPPARPHVLSAPTDLKP